jgi:plastocyanin/N-acetylneuraminic acid mutarotase
MNERLTVKRNSGISSLAAVVVVIVVLILTSGAVAISFDAISVGQHTSTLTLTVVNTTTASVVSSIGTNASLVSSNLSSSGNYWTPAAPMIVNRSFSAVAALNNGSVLVAGGFAGAVPNSSIASAEMYNPTTNKWTMIAPMPVGTAGARAATLNNGDVLVAGGLGNKGLLTTCQLYEPSTNTWSLTGNLTKATFDEQIVVLNNGNVLVIGGDFSGGENNATQIYNPSSGTWSDAAPQPIARADMIVVKLSNGNILVAGGHTANAPTLLSEIFDPTTNTWTPTKSLVTPGGDSGGVLLKNGDVLMVGGYTTYNDSDNSAQYLYTAQLFNITTGAWNLTGDMNYPRGEIGLSTVLMNNGEVLVPGGNYQPETGQDTAEVYNPATGRWSMAGTMSVDRGSGAMAAVLDTGEVLVFGGLLPHICTFCGSGTSGQDLATNSADLFNPNATLTSNNSTAASSSISKGPGFQIEIPNDVGSSTSLSFSPENITLVIGVNNTVTWTNDDSVVHTVTSEIVPSGASSFNSNNMNPGSIFTYTFTVPGTYTYHCIYHAWMQGTITVKSG